MRILLADDQPDVRAALRLLLEQDAAIEVIGEAADARALRSELERLCPDLVLLDWELPGLNGEGCLTALRESCPGVMVVALSGRPEARKASLEAGANLFVSKVDPPERLLMAIDEAARRVSR